MLFGGTTGDSVRLISLKVTPSSECKKTCLPPQDISPSDRTTARNFADALFCIQCKMACMLKIEGEQTMKRFVMAITLALALSVTAMAGEVHTTGAPAPGEIPISGSQSPVETGIAAGEIPMTGLSALLAILNLAF